MFRTVKPLVCFFGCVTLGVGCANFVETRAIKQFMSAVESENLERLKSATTENFERKTLRLSQSLKDFKILRLPDGDTSIVNVEDVSENEKQVIVEVGESKKKVKYRLKRKPETNKWVVDDVYVKQKRNGITSVKSVTEQMDLLLTVREVLTVWDQAQRDNILATTTSEFGQLLSDLPPVYLEWLAKRIVGKNSNQTDLRPNAQMEEGAATVRLPHAKGEIVISFKRQQERWKVSNVAVESRSEQDRISSVRQLAVAVRTGVDFLARYQASDKQALSELCTKGFFQRSLSPAVLSAVKLPAPEWLNDKYQIKIQNKYADFLIERNADWVKIRLVREGDGRFESPTRFLIQDVTIYEKQGSQEKRLSALFTAHAVLQIFSESFASRNLDHLSYSATPDFNRRVWGRLNPTTFRDITIPEIENATPKILSTIFQGPITEVTVTQGSRALTYVLLDRGGQLLVDDVLMPVFTRPNSLKTTLELSISIKEFAVAMRLDEIELLMRNSSKDFNRLVWHQTKQIPQAGFDVDKHLRSPLNSISIDQDQAVVILGDDHWGAKVTLVKEREQYLVDDVLLIAGLESDQRTELKQTLRILLASNTQKNQNRNHTSHDLHKTSPVLSPILSPLSQDPSAATLISPIAQPLR